MRALILAAVVLLAPAIAHADPCKAIPDRGPAPEWIKPGAVFSGTARYEGDGDSLCVSDSPDPATWIEVRLADFNAPELRELGGPEAKERLQGLVSGRRLVCTVRRGQP